MNTVVDGLRALIARGFRFQHLTDEDGHVAVLIDRIHIYDENAATAARARPHDADRVLVPPMTTLSR